MGFPDFRGGVDPLLVLLIAYAVDAAVGDPRWLYRRVPHPVELIGRLIDRLETRLNDPAAADAVRLRNGVVVTVAVTALGLLCGAALTLVLRGVPGGWLLEAAIASTLIASRGLYDGAEGVARGLARGLEEGRRAVAHIVGRDPKSLDAHGVARAAIESVAENFSDGVVAPVFWYVLAGLPGLAAYKAINTLDSMIGHEHDRFRTFGRVAAGLDDAANWFPARLAGVLISAAARVHRDADGRAAWSRMRSDAGKHRSPNAGWPEAAMAGGLGLSLIGPRTYGGEPTPGAWLGDGRREATTADIRRALAVYLRASAGLAVLIAGLVPI